jgi:uncharacterized membrane protein
MKNTVLTGILLISLLAVAAGVITHSIPLVLGGNFVVLLFIISGFIRPFSTYNKTQKK